MPSSTVNIISHEKHHCFQCQESSQIACHCPNVWCFKCDVYGHIAMDCPHRIPPSGTPAHNHRPKSHSCHHTRSASCHSHDDRYRCSRSRSQSHPCRYHSKSHCDSYGGCSRSHHRDNRCHHRNSHTQTLIHIILTMTLHTVDHLPTDALQLTQDITADHALNQPTKPTKKTSHQSSSHFRRSHGKIYTKRNLRFTIDNPQTDFSSSDDHTSDSEENSDHLN